MELKPNTSYYGIGINYNGNLQKVHVVFQENIDRIPFYSTPALIKINDGREETRILDVYNQDSDNVISLSLEEYGEEEIEEGIPIYSSFKEAKNAFKIILDKYVENAKEDEVEMLKKQLSEINSLK